MANIVQFCTKYLLIINLMPIILQSLNSYIKCYFAKQFSMQKTNCVGNIMKKAIIVADSFLNSFK